MCWISPTNMRPCVLRLGVAVAMVDDHILIGMLGLVA